MKNLKGNLLKINYFKTELESQVTEIQNFFDDKSEKWKVSEAGEKYIEYIEALESIISECDNFNDNFEE